MAHSVWQETSGWTAGFQTGLAGVRVDPTQPTSGTLPRDARRLRHTLPFADRRVAVSFSLLRVFQISRCECFHVFDLFCSDFLIFQFVIYINKVSSRKLYILYSTPTIYFFFIFFFPWTQDELRPSKDTKKLTFSVFDRFTRSPTKLRFLSRNFKKPVWILF